MRAIRWCVVVAFLVVVPGCAAPVEDTPSAPPAASPGGPSAAPVVATVDDVQQICAAALGGDEKTGEACEALSVCQLACIAAAGIGCAAVHAACATAGAVTLGGVALPCLVAVPAACAAISGGMFYCTDKWCGGDDS